MSEKKSKTPEKEIPPYAWRTHEVIEIELEQYLKKRRKANGIKEAPTPENLAGLCISGGGVRSSTLGLGMLQAFIKKNKLKYFDYLSTVSGGGFIGACLSSLMSAEPARRDKYWNNKGYPPIENNNLKFDPADIGLEEHNSLFTTELYEYPRLDTGKLNSKHQLIHLRQHGEYLSPHKSLKDWDVHRMIGALIGGIVTNVSTFLLLLAVVVLMHHALLGWMSGGRFIDTLQQPTTFLNEHLETSYKSEYLAYVQDSMLANKIGRANSMPAPVLERRYALNDVYPDSLWVKLSASAQLNALVTYSLSPQFELVWLGLMEHWDIAWAFWGFGFVVAALFIFWARSKPLKITIQEQEEQEYTGKKPHDKLYDRGGEEDMLDLLENKLIKVFYNLGLWGVPLIAYLVTAYLTLHANSDFNYFVMLALPLCYSLGLFLGLHSMIFLYFINNGAERVSGWLYRSYYTGMQGGSLLLVVLTFLFPVAIILLFGKHGLAVKLSLSFVPVMTAYYFTIQSLSSRGGNKGLFSDILRRLQNPLLNLSIFLFVGLAFAWISQALTGLEQFLLNNWAIAFSFCINWSSNHVISALLVLALLGFLLMGLIVNSNDVSLHYFYRDRLAEAFLRTSGRVAVKRSGMPSEEGEKLMRVNLRNHVDLRLQDLGKGNDRAPYHLIVAALNLQGSHDLSAKTLKSEHFIFSKYFIGSRSTGYVNTAKYNYGSTKLSSAMTISAAAVSSGMGSLSFAASNFYMTLFNLRTGYWFDNPKHFIVNRQKAESKKHANSAADPEVSAGSTSKKIKSLWAEWLRKHPLWLRYSWRELTGNLSADTPKVYVSDGGHTGDNLGLLPLIQRRCSTIVIADFEEDSTFSFNSFSQAMRLAKSLYEVDIHIDLMPLMPKKNDDGVLYSPASVAEGVITYNLVKYVKHPKTGIQAPVKYQKKGKLIYLKSSVNLLHEAAHVPGANVVPPPIFEPAPVFVLNYFKKNPHFPHQSTADQYFDEVQFAAYRMLGEHIGNQAAPKVTFGALS